MAWFSEEYCIKHMFDADEKKQAIEFSDFSIDEEASKIDPGYFVNIICEGYGFDGISKGESGQVYLLYGNNAIKFEDLDKFELAKGEERKSYLIEVKDIK